MAKNEENNEDDKREDEPTWAQRLSQSVEKLTEILTAEPEEQDEPEVQKVRVPPIPEPPSEPEEQPEEVPEEQPEEQPEDKPKKKNFLDWLF